jgi:carbon-monoxide dehydrogenase large subunit
MARAVAPDLQAKPVTFVGQPIARREDSRLLRGAGHYLDDIDLPGAYEVAFVRSPHPSARIVSVDASAALELPGVLGVWTGTDLGSVNGAIPPKVTNPSLLDYPRRSLPVDEVNFVGEPVAAVVAVSRYVAEDAVELVSVQYEPRASIGSTGAALVEDAPLVHEVLGTNVAIHVTQTAGDPDAALARAPHTLSETFTLTRAGGHSMETRGVLARHDGATGTTVVWDTTQSPHYVRNMIANLFGEPEDNVRVIAPPDVGGGFGPKAQFYPEELVIPFLARTLDHPCKWIEDRQENMVATMMERTQVHRATVGFDDDGRVLVLKNVFEHDQGAYCAGLQVPMITLTTVVGQYRIPNIHTELIGCYTNMVPTSSVRGAGRPQAVAVIERMMDRVAEYLDLDPAELRRKNMIEPDEMPYNVGLTFRDGSALTYDSGNFPELLRVVLDRLDYDGEKAAREEATSRGAYRGIGLAGYVEGCGLGPYEGSRIRLLNDGTFRVTLAAAAQGQGYETVYAQIAADAIGTTMDEVSVVTGDTSRIPFGQGTFASRITATAGPATMEAGEAMRERVLGVAEVLLKTSSANLTISGNRVVVVDNPVTSVTLAEIAQVANVGKHGITLPAKIAPGLETTSYFAPERAAYASGLHGTVVEVDAETGRIEIKKYVIGHDCGTVINPVLVDGQVLGGFAAGIGNALLEESLYDATAQPQSTSYLDYSLPSALDVPPVELVHIHTPSPLNPLGAKGAGEGGTIPAPAAIANAVEDALRATGARITHLPLTPARVVEAIHGTRS